jgi:hypothetical protein
LKKASVIRFIRKPARTRRVKATPEFVGASKDRNNFGESKGAQEVVFFSQAPSCGLLDECICQHFPEGSPSKASSGVESFNFYDTIN